MPMRKLILIVLSLCCSSVFAQTASRVLVPLSSAVVEGRGGTKWSTELRIFNAASQEAVLLYAGCFTGGPCIRTFSVPAGRSIEAPVSRPPSIAIPLLIWGDADTLSQLSFDLRIRESGQPTAGTSIPVVREAEFRTESLVLQNVPINSDFRVAVRIYEVEQREVRFDVVVMDPRTNLTLGSLMVETDLGPERPSEMPEIPARAEVLDVQSALGLSDRTGEAMIVVRARDHARFWGFASITHNASQHVTVVSP